MSRLSLEHLEALQSAVYQQASPITLCRDLVEAGLLHPFKIENREDSEEFHRILASSLCPTQAAVEALTLLGEPKVVADAVVRLQARAQREADAALSEEEQAAWVKRAHKAYPGSMVPFGCVREGNPELTLTMITAARNRLRRRAVELKEALDAFDDMRRAVAAGDGLPEPRSVRDLLHDALAGDVQAVSELRSYFGVSG